MQDFARWMGKLGAAGAALLATIWLWEASPDKYRRYDPGPPDCMRARTDRLFGQVSGDWSLVTMAEARLRYCPPEPRKHWDQALLTRGLLAGGGALVILLLSAMVPGGRAVMARRPPARHKQ